MKKYLILLMNVCLILVTNDDTRYDMATSNGPLVGCLKTTCACREQSTYNACTSGPGYSQYRLTVKDESPFAAISGLIVEEQHRLFNKIESKFTDGELLALKILAYKKIEQH